MYPKRIIQLLFIVSCLLIFSSFAFASSGASILYQETQEQGLWHYAFTFSNTSTNNEYLHSVWLNFDAFYTISNPVLPAGWGGPWGKISSASFEEAHTSINEIMAGNELSGFGFSSNRQIGNIDFTAYFNNHQGTTYSYSGEGEPIPPVVPEPVSAVLFVVGVATLGAGRFIRRKK
jgi:hypothetical protein